MEDYRPNSNRFKENESNKSNKPIPEKKVEKVISGSARTKKKTDMQRFADVFISEDVNNVKSYVLLDVLVPAIKKAVSDIVTNGIDMILYGETGHTRRDTPGSRVSYNGFYNNDRRRDERAPIGRGNYSRDDIILTTRGEAIDVLTSMDDLVRRYGFVTVADMYDLVGITCNYTDNNYGWTDVRNVEPVPVRGGYMLRLPRALPIN